MHELSIGFQNKMYRAVDPQDQDWKPQSQSTPDYTAIHNKPDLYFFDQMIWGQ